MARKEQPITIKAEGRDKGKTFVLTEMPATKATKWALRAFLAMARNGVNIPEEIAGMGMRGILVIGFVRAIGSMAYDDAEALTDEMMECVEYVANVKEPLASRRRPMEEDIEEIETHLFLRRAVFELHVDFSSLAARFKLAQSASKSETSPTT